MRMVNALRTQKSRQYKSFERANILLAILLISVLSTGLIFHYSFSLKNTAFRSHVFKAIQAKKQALALARAAFIQLKSVASEDDCAMYEKEKHFYFQRNNALGRAIEYEFYDGADHKLVPNAGYCVNGIWEVKLPFACCFDKPGLRKSLPEIMQKGDIPEYIIDKEGWVLAKNRWGTLKHNDTLPPDLFPPLIWKIQVFEVELDQETERWMSTYWKNPYDRSLRSGAVKVESCTNCGLPSVCDTGIWYNAARSDLAQPFKIFGFEHLPDYFGRVFQDSLPDFGPFDRPVDPGFLVGLKIKNGHKYIIENPQGTFLLNRNIGNREEGFDLDLVAASKSQKPGKWRGLNSKIRAFEANQANRSSLKDLFPTKTWIDELDACFFWYNIGEPYSKIGNFKTWDEAIQAQRDYFWNEAVANPAADVFYFNGPKVHIEERLRAYGVPQEQVPNIANEIVKNQPYASAASYLGKLAESKVHWPKIKNVLHRFEYLSHRTEKFKIKSWYGGYICEMVVQRGAVDDTQRTWKIISIHLSKKEIKIPHSR